MELPQSMTLPQEKKTHTRYCLPPWVDRCHEGEGATGTYKIRSLSPAFLRHWELSSYLDYRELKTVNTTLHGFLAQLPHSSIPAASFLHPSLVPSTFIKDTERLPVWDYCILFLSPHHRNPLTHPKVFQTSALNCAQVIKTG